MKLLLEGSDSSKNRAVLQVLQKSTEKNDVSIMKPEVNYLHGSKDFTMFDGLGPVLIGFFTFFFVFILSGVSFVRERLSGTLERLLSTPVRRWEIVAGYIIGFGIFAFYTIHYYRKFFRLYFRFIRSWLHMANVTYYMYALFNCTNIRYVFIGIRK